MLDLLSNFVLRVRSRLNTGDSLVKKQVGNNIMFLDLKDPGVSSVLLYKRYGRPEREAAFMKILRQELEKGVVALDIGANIGYVTLIMAELIGATGKIYAFEPEPHNYHILSKNIVANDYNSFVFTHQMGVSNLTGTLKFHISDASNLHSMSSTKHSKDAIDINVISLDDFLENKECPNFIKMDIEGHEVEALEGMYNTLKNSDCSVKILMEVHPVHYSKDHSLEAQLRRLIDIGFNTKYVISAGVAKPDFFVKNGYEPMEVIFTDSFYRGIYDNISNEDMLMAACHMHKQFVENKNIYSNKIVRSVLIEKPAS